MSIEKGKKTILLYKTHMHNSIPVNDDVVCLAMNATHVAAVVAVSEMTVFRWHGVASAVFLAVHKRQVISTIRFYINLNKGFEGCFSPFVRSLPPSAPIHAYYIIYCRKIGD